MAKVLSIIHRHPTDPGLALVELSCFATIHSVEYSVAWADRYNAEHLYTLHGWGKRGGGPICPSHRQDSDSDWLPSKDPAMSLINNDRDMQSFLTDLRSPGEFSAKDLADIALSLPVSHLAAALYAKAGHEPFVRADTPEKKAAVVARLLHAWCLSPDLRLGQLVSNLSCNEGYGELNGPDDCDPFYTEDGVLAERADALAGVFTISASTPTQKG